MSVAAIPANPSLVPSSVSITSELPDDLQHRWIIEKSSSMIEPDCRLVLILVDDANARFPRPIGFRAVGVGATRGEARLAASAIARETGRKLGIEPSVAVATPRSR
jgi:hypothetical protein